MRKLKYVESIRIQLDMFESIDLERDVRAQRLKENIRTLWKNFCLLFPDGPASYPILKERVERVTPVLMTRYSEDLIDDDVQSSHGQKGEDTCGL